MTKTSKIYTQEQIDDRQSDYICFDCGKQFIDKKDDEGFVFTVHTGLCGLCEETKAITHMRAWNWLKIKSSNKEL